MSMKNPAPAFQIYPNDELANPDNLLRDWDARGMHMHFTCIAWNQHPPCSVPDDDAILRRWVGNPSDTDWERLRPQIFRGWKAEDGRLINTGLQREFEKQIAYRESRKHGAEARWRGDAHASAMHAGCNALQSSSSSASSSSSSERKEKIAVPASPETADSPPKSVHKKRGMVLADEEFIQVLKANPAYAGIDIDRELGKLDAWLITPKGHGKHKTRQRVVNWLSKVDRPLSLGSGNGIPTSCRRQVRKTPSDRFLKPCGQPIVVGSQLCARCTAEDAARASRAKEAI